MFRSFGRNWFEYGLEKETYELGERSLSGNEFNCLFENEAGQFQRVGFSQGLASPRDGRGFVAADFDRDGDLDVFLVNSNQPCQYFENGGVPGNRWLTVQLRGNHCNRFGVGARVTLTCQGTSQVREIRLGSGYLSSPPPEAQFGLGPAARVDRLEIRWPDGQTQILTDLAPDQVLVIEEPVAD